MVCYGMVWYGMVWYRNGIGMVPVGGAARDPVLVVDAHVCSVGAEASDALQPVRTVRRRVCVAAKGGKGGNGMA
jgi:hypothetical protein